MRLTSNTGFFALTAFIVALMAAAAPVVHAQESPKVYSDRFLGLSWELSASPADDAHPVASLEAETLALMVTLGDRGIFGFLPVRVRAGLGWWPGKPFALAAGLEFAVLERLNSMQARMFGLYILTDGTIGVSGEGFVASFRPSCRVLVPINSVGGLALGSGWDTRLGLYFSLDYMGGAYIMH